MNQAYLTDCEADNLALQQLLQPALASVQQTGGLLPGDLSDLQILDLACGPCREIEAVCSSLRPLLRRDRAAIRFVGADIRAAEIHEARRRGALTAPAGIHAEFLVADCGKLDTLRELGATFDLVFLRHQNYWNDPKLWRRIFESGLRRLKPTGVLAITSYFDDEHRLALRALDKIGARLLLTVRNPQSRPLSTRGKSVDRHLALFRHPPPEDTPAPSLILPP